MRLAAQNNIPVVSTWRLLKAAHEKRWGDADTLWGYMQTLTGSSRGALPGVRDRPSFNKWLSA